VSQRAVHCSRGAAAPKEPMESVNMIRRTLFSYMAHRTLRIPLTVTCSATLGLVAVSTDSGAARFHTVCTRRWRLKMRCIV